MAKEPPWKYLAGIDTSNTLSLKRCMTIVLSRLTGSKCVNQRVLNEVKLLETEKEAIATMFREMTGNDLLERMTRRWARNYNKKVDEIFDATNELKRDVTYYVRKPKLYKEEYKVAEQAFFEGKWVYMGQQVDWDEVPKQEVKRSMKAVIKRAKNDAWIDGIDYMPDPGMENVSMTEDNAEAKATKEAEKGAESEQSEEEEEEEDDEEEDTEDYDSDSDLEVDKPRGRKRTHYASEEEEWMPVRKGSHQKKTKVISPVLSRQHKKPKMFRQKQKQMEDGVFFPGLL